MLSGTLSAANFIGNAMDCAISLEGHFLKVFLHPEHMPPIGSPITVYVANHHCLAMRA